jgi:hypothetical protein
LYSKRIILEDRTRKGSVMLNTKRPRKPLPAAKAHLNELLDEALEETFPASDPIAIAVELESSEPETGPDAELRVLIPPP